jgi:hypothetical protein
VHGRHNNSGVHASPRIGSQLALDEANSLYQIVANPKSRSISFTSNRAATSNPELVSSPGKISTRYVPWHQYPVRYSTMVGEFTDATFNIKHASPISISNSRCFSIRLKGKPQRLCSVSTVTRQKKRGKISYENPPAATRVRLFVAQATETTRLY